MYVVGETTATSALATAGTVRTTAGAGGDGFVAAVSQSGTLSWLTLLAGSGGSTGIDRALAVAVDPSDGNLVIVGETEKWAKVIRAANIKV